MTQANAEALKQLANALRNLKIAQADVKEAYRQLSIDQASQVPAIVDEDSSEEFELSSVEESSSESSRSSRQSVVLGEKIANTPFRIGVRVKIKNPNRNQQSEGIVIGKTKGKSFFIRVKTPNNDIVLRRSFNLEIVDCKQHGRKRKSGSTSK